MVLVIMMTVANLDNRTQDNRENNRIDSENNKNRLKHSKATK